MEQKPDPTILTDIVRTRMPYGKYKGTIIRNIPVFYLEWMSTQGFPEGRLGMLLSTVFVIKTNGLDHLLDRIKP
ncbi:MAG: DUF3820 family protein [Saprospiraceae bacterium]|nr:DUF3820 family protein [Saprospiraceae bacterium]